MEYEGVVKKILDGADADVGDHIMVTRGKDSFKGIVMPHVEFSGKDILTLKLDNGYNIGIKMDDTCKVNLIQKREEARRAEAEYEKDPRKPTVSILGTGGTIASYVEYRTGAVFPAERAKDLVFTVPELADICDVRAKVLFSIFSEDMTSEHWKKLAEEVAAELNSGSKAVVIPHGTDTLGYTAAALSFMLDDLSGPVVLVGSQRSSDRPSSDAFLNLTSAARLATEDLGEVVIVMHGETSDSFAAIHRGTKVRKMHSSRRDAFVSINQKPLGSIHEDGRVEWLGEHRSRSSGPVKLKTEMNNEVVLVYFYPGMPVSVFRSIVKDAGGVVIAGTGLGHVSSTLFKEIGSLVDAGTPVVMTTQCLHGRVNMNVYSAGRDLLLAGVIPGEDMLPETAFIKLMWVLGQTRDLEEIRELMTMNLKGEINPAIKLEEYSE
ncbi:MAG: Glu-tRNA(Gln) amidotransferase subunit GatD [Thermoplasmata archaeon]